jgi:hypothetical protein
VTDDEPRHQDRLQRNPPPPGLKAYLQTNEPEAEETASCKAFGYLRGIRDSATSVEFRFLDGNGRLDGKSRFLSPGRKPWATG